MRSPLDPVYRSHYAPLLILPPLAFEDREQLVRHLRRMKLFDEYRFIPSGVRVAGLRTKKVVVLPWREVCNENRELMDKVIKWHRETIYTRLMPRGEWIEL